MFPEAPSHPHASTLLDPALRVRFHSFNKNNAEYNPRPKAGQEADKDTSNYSKVWSVLQWRYSRELSLDRRTGKASRKKSHLYEPCKMDRNWPR